MLFNFINGKNLISKMNDLEKRITEALDSTGLKDAEIARKLKLSRATISQWRSGGVKSLKAESASNIERLTGYSANWISTGVGDKMSGDHISQDIVDVPLLSVEASMGAGIDVIGVDVLSSIRVKVDWVDNRLRTLSRRENLRFIHAYGDSMEPTFSSGDILLVDIGHTTPDIDGIYVLEAQRMLFIKRVSRNMSGELIITSDNPKIKTSETLNGSSEVVIHGRVVWAWNGKLL